MEESCLPETRLDATQPEGQERKTEETSESSRTEKATQTIDNSTLKNMQESSSSRFFSHCEASSSAIPMAHTDVPEDEGDFPDEKIDVQSTSTGGGDEEDDDKNRLCKVAPCDQQPDEKSVLEITKKIATTPIQLIALPIDALHCIATFLSPFDWAQFGQTSQANHKVCAQVLCKVRLHGYKCATEIVTSWKMGQHADAKELAALYISQGVPVYPKSLGHSYHTIGWRMQVEAGEMRERQDASAVEEEEEEEGDFGGVETEENDVVSPPVDSFFTERLEFRQREGYNSKISYLEEKCLFWVDRFTLNRDAARSSVVVRRSTLLPRTEQREELAVFARLDDGALPSKVQMKVHHHLLHQHLQRRHLVDDQDGTLVTPPISLSVDFFHPTCRSRSRTISYDKQALSGDGTMRSLAHDPADEMLNDPEFTAFLQALENMRPMVVPFNDDDAVPEEVLGNQRAQQPATSIRPDRLKQLLNVVDLEPYSSALASDGRECSQQMKRHLRSRFAYYERRLETFLSHNNNVGFEECMLDFWDDFFPCTANIHYYDRNTAVPRISGLKKFLTEPCAKSIGVVQCEIERIKISAKGKGVNVKGRLFPTYEYRLFIRNRPHQGAPESALADLNGAERRDTLLIVAKNRGRKHQEPSAASAVKKGSNNYYLYMPQQSDIDDHYNAVNEGSSSAQNVPNGACQETLAAPNEAAALLGRLQSNFIGTEFQIFTSHLRQEPASRKSDLLPSSVLPSDDDLDYDSGVSSDNNSSRLSRFGRRSRRCRHNHPNWDLRSDASDCSSTTKGSRCRTPQPSRRVKSADVDSTTALPGRAGRSNRRAIANTPENSEQQQQPVVLYEEEDGVMTYTANLLGSRPRIMDVCIPKVSPDGVPGAVWKQHLEAAEEHEDGHMLQCFRQLVQRLDSADPETIGQDTAPEAGEGLEDFGLLALQNRPPWWNVELASFVLNFGGRVSVASVKNFQLCDRTDQERIMLQFGRISGRHSFTMDFQHPLTAIQAFSIAISSLQSKLSFG